jgi:hypothetical protein
MAEFFGDYNDQLPNSQEYLTIVFSPSSVPLQQRWSNNGLSADFMADYFATFFPQCEEPIADNSLKAKAEVKSLVSFIANELLENAMKFSDIATGYPISITLQLHEESLVFIATNSLSPETIAPFQAFIQEIISSDPGEMLVRQLERNAEDESSEGSGLGILTLIADYFAKVGWKFDRVQQDPEVSIVTTMVYLKM